MQKNKVELYSDAKAIVGTSRTLTQGIPIQTLHHTALFDIVVINFHKQNMPYSFFARALGFTPTDWMMIVMIMGQLISVQVYYSQTTASVHAKL